MTDEPQPPPASDPERRAAPASGPRPARTGPPLPAPTERGSSSADVRPRRPEYRGEELDPERGPGLGCFWFQMIVLGFFIVIIPVGLNLGWPFEVLAILLFVVIGLLLLTGQTVIFLLRLVAADRRSAGRRRPLASSTKTVGEMEDELGGAEAETSGAAANGAPGTPAPAPAAAPLAAPAPAAPPLAAPAPAAPVAASVPGHDPVVDPESIIQAEPANAADSEPSLGLAASAAADAEAAVEHAEPAAEPAATAADAAGGLQSRAEESSNATAPAEASERSTESRRDDPDASTAAPAPTEALDEPAGAEEPDPGVRQ